MEKINEAGNHDLVIGKIEAIMHRFNHDDESYEIKITAVTKDQQKCAVLYIPITSNIIQQGKHQGRTESEVAFETLASLGVPGDGQNLAKMDVVMGLSISVYGAEKEKDGKTYINWYISQSFEKTANVSEIMRLYGLKNTTKPTGNVKSRADAIALEGGIPF